MRRLRAGFRKARARAAPGLHPAGITARARGARWDGRGALPRPVKARPGAAKCRSIQVCARCADLRAVERRNGAALSQESAQHKIGAPFGAPSPRIARGTESRRRRIRRLSNNTGGEAWLFLSVRPRDPPTLAASFGGFESAEAHSAKAESGDPDWFPACAGMNGEVALAV